MKVAPLHRALAPASWCEVRLVHTGQHYDTNMSDAFFRDFHLPDPAHHLEVGSGTHAEQTGRTMIAYEAACERDRPAVIVVVGDVNATAACAMVGAKLCIPVVHLEAGLRSRDRRMPEEINRLVTDAIADLLWTPSPDADSNLSTEGVAKDRIERIGNIMIDSFDMLRQRIETAETAHRLGVTDSPYAVVTVHRPSNVDEADKLITLVQMLEEVAARMKIVFPVHPRTRRRLQEFDLDRQIGGNPRIQITEPLGYVEFMNLVIGCTMAITDSGGVQEETTYLGIPCVTLRENTERPITLTQGTNRLMRPSDLPHAADEVLRGNWTKGTVPEYWDGCTAERAAQSLERFIRARTAH
jgi:UDP-N-acetylglucosamine 2-epimerase (non-hydrolysing)